MSGVQSDNDRLRNVAVLVRSLDKRTTTALLGQLSLSQRDAIHAEMEKLGDVSPEEQQKIACQFLQQLDGQRNVENQPGDQAPETSAQKERSLTETPADRATTGCARRTLLEVRPDVLSQVLRDEQPQTVAVVLADLPPAKAAALLELLPNRVQHAVVCRLAEFGSADQDIVDDVHQALATQIERTRVQQRSRQTGARVLRSILNATHDAARTRWIRKLSLVDAKLAAALRPDTSCQGERGLLKGATTDSADRAPLDWLSDLKCETLREVALRVGRDVTLLALAGTDAACADELLARLPSDMAESLRSGLKNLGPLRLADICQAQRLMLDVVHTVDAHESAAAAEEFGRLKLSA